MGCSENGTECYFPREIEANHDILGENVREILYEGMDSRPVRQGDGAIVVQADDVDGFAYALELLLKNDALREEMGENAYHITIPYFTWKDMTRRFLEAINVELP